MGTAHHHLKKLRIQINTVDHRILRLLARRMAIARRIGAVKSKTGLPIFNRAREAEAHAWRHNTAKTLKLNPVSVRRIFAAIMAMAKKGQRKRK